MKSFDNNSKKLKSKLVELTVKVQKAERKYSIVYFFIITVLLVTLLFLIGFFMYKTGSFDMAVKVLTPIGVALFVLSLLFKDHYIYKFSGKLRNLSKEINDIVIQLNDRLNIDFELAEKDSIREEIINNLPRAESISNLPSYEVKPIEKFTKFVGVVSLIIGGVSAIASTIVVDKVHPLVFFIMLVMGAWLHIYGYFAAFTKRPIMSMYWPTIVIVSLTFPPLIAFLVTMNLEEWLNILLTCIGAVVGLTLFAIIMVNKVTKPNKEKNDYLLNNRKLLYIIDTERLNDHHHGFEMRNLKNDYVFDKVSKTAEHIFVLMKYVDGEYIFIEEIKTVEFLTAKYLSAKKLVELYQENDERPVFEFDESIIDGNILNVQRFSDKLKSLDFLDDKIEVVDDTITITFNKYLEVYLSDDYCSYLNTHFHPTLKEGFEFITQLVNEDIVFVQSKITKKWKSYPGYYVDELLKKNKKKRVRIFSAMKIYKE